MCWRGPRSRVRRASRGEGDDEVDWRGMEEEE